MESAEPSFVRHNMKRSRKFEDDKNVEDDKRELYKLELGVR